MSEEPARVLGSVVVFAGCRAGPDFAAVSGYDIQNILEALKAAVPSNPIRLNGLGLSSATLQNW